MTTDYDYKIPSTASVYCSECGAEIGCYFIYYGENRQPLCPMCYHHVNDELGIITGDRSD